MKHASPHKTELIIAVVAFLIAVGSAIWAYFANRNYQNESDKSSTQANSDWNQFTVFGALFILALTVAALAASWNLIKEHHKGYILIPIFAAALSGGMYAYLYNQQK